MQGGEDVQHLAVGEAHLHGHADVRKCYDGPLAVRRDVDTPPLLGEEAPQGFRGTSPGKIVVSRPSDTSTIRSRDGPPTSS